MKLRFITLFISLFIGFSCSPSATYAHAPHEGYFTITHMRLDDKVEIRAELPWSMNHALAKAYPALKKPHSEEDYLKALKQYVKENLILYDDDNQPFLLEKILEIDTHEHSHHSTFDFIYSGEEDLNRLQNTIMFETSTEQTNYHIIEGFTQIYYPTTHGKSSFELPSSIALHPLWFVIIAFPLTILFFWRIIKNKYISLRS